MATILLEPKDGAYACTDACAYGGTDATANSGPSERRACGGCSKGDRVPPVVIASLDGSLVIDVGVLLGVEIHDASGQVVKGAVRKGDGFGFEMDGCSSAEAAAAGDFSDSAFKRRSDRENDAAVVLHVLRERSDEVRACAGAVGCEGADEMGAENGAGGQGVFGVRIRRDDASVSTKSGDLNGGRRVLRLLVGVIGVIREIDFRWTGFGWHNDRDSGLRDAGVERWRVRRGCRVDGDYGTGRGYNDGVVERLRVRHAGVLRKRLSGEK